MTFFLVLLAFLAGFGISWLLTVKRVTREVAAPAGAAGIVAGSSAAPRLGSDAAASEDWPLVVHEQDAAAEPVASSRPAPSSAGRLPRLRGAHLAPAHDAGDEHTVRFGRTATEDPVLEERTMTDAEWAELLGTAGPRTPAASQDDLDEESEALFAVPADADAATAWNEDDADEPRHQGTPRPAAAATAQDPSHAASSTAGYTPPTAPVAPQVPVAEPATGYRPPSAATAVAAPGALEPSHDPLPDGGTPAGYVVKGDQKALVYVVPGDPDYERAKPQIWFTTEEAAIAAGYAHYEPAPQVEQ